MTDTTPKYIATAPERIWLQIDPEGGYEDEPFPDCYGDEVTWCKDSVGGTEVAYIRADIAARLLPVLRELVACKDAAGPSVGAEVLPAGYRWTDAWQAARKWMEGK